MLPFSTISGQGADSAKIQSSKRNYLGSYLSDAGYLYTAPLRWKQKDWLKFGVIGGIGVGLYSADDNIQRWMIKSKTETSKEVSTIFEKFGNTGSTSIALGATLLTGLITKNKKTQYVSLLALKSSLLSGLLAQTFKHIGHRSRPNSNDNKNTWHGPSFGGGNKAFPSGHTATAFAIATTLSHIYREKKWVAISSYTVATLTGFSRVHDNKHWTTDVFAGAVLGYFSAKLILINEDRNERGITLLPSTQFDALSLTVCVPL